MAPSASSRTHGRSGFVVSISAPVPGSTKPAESRAASSVSSLAGKLADRASDQRIFRARFSRPHRADQRPERHRGPLGQIPPVPPGGHGPGAGQGFCEAEDREVTNDEIGKGYQLSKEQVIPISDDELRDLPLPTAKAIGLEAFVPLESVDPIRIGEGYYLQPSGQVAAKPYKLLRGSARPLVEGRRREVRLVRPGAPWPGENQGRRHRPTRDALARRDPRSLRVAPARPRSS
ncbi:hypothetical protein QC385_20405 [Streptomyces sp. DH10]|nr:Ku protein [Streptomyces sp. DH10]MDG9710531.1 hypothetical protein [Streptomyces sp. DH10]